MKKYLFTLATALLTLVAIAQDQVPSFPGAEGHGRYVTGGKAGEVRHVTTLDDGSTKGTLRWAVNGTTKKIVVFDVGGIIALNSELTIGANTTILGQTAPSPGITIRYYTVRPNGNNIVMRYIRIRRGEERYVNDGADATWARNFNGIILDHCSFSWSIDEVASFYDNRDFTMQWCTVAEALANPGHSKGEHSYGGIWGGKDASFHHNLIAHVQNRAPRLNGARYGWDGYDKTKYKNTIEAERVDLRNNVMYNWGTGNGAYAGMGGYHNIVNNYYKAGPATKNTTRVFQCGHTTGKDRDNGSAIDPKQTHIYGHFYINGNYVTAAGSNAANYDWKGVIIDNGNSTIQDTIKLTAPIDPGEVTTHTAENAFAKVLAYCGASLYRDNVDKRYMTEAENGTTTYTGTATKQGDGTSVTHYPGIIDFVRDQGTYELTSASRPSGFDTDGDGIPDAWETANGLNPNSASDGQAYTIDPKKYYTNFEVYANSLVQHIMLAENNDAESAVKDYYPAYKKEDGTVVPAINDGTGTNGTIKWVYDANPAAIIQPATVDDDIASQVSTSVSAGAHIFYKQKGTVSGVNVTYLGTNTQDATASDANAVKFTVTPASGYTFEPTGVSFVSNSTVSGTNGCLSAYWLSGDGTTTEVCGETKSSYGSSLTEISKNFSANASEKPSSLVINLYKLPTNKVIGLAQIVINGIVKSATGIETLTGENAATLVATEYYSLQGARVSQPQRGICIEVKRFSDGTKQSRKVIIK